MEGFWGIVLVLGPLLLIGAIVYATMRNRKAPPGSERRADIGAARLQEDIERHQDRTLDP